MLSIRCVAAIGVIRERHNLSSKKKLILQLALLLPANEYNDKERFRERLELFLSRFSFRDTVLKVKLEKFFSVVLKEAVLASIAVIRNGADWLQQRKLGGC